MNVALTALCGRRHLWIPTADIANILEPHGLKIEDAIFCGREGRANCEIFHGDINISNAWLVLYWKKGDVVADYEITAYVS